MSNVLLIPSADSGNIGGGATDAHRPFKVFVGRRPRLLAVALIRAVALTGVPAVQRDNRRSEIPARPNLRAVELGRPLRVESLPVLVTHHDDLIGVACDLDRDQRGVGVVHDVVQLSWTNR